MSNNVATVNKIYKAFVKGDVSTIMNYLSDNLEWEPWSDNYRYKEEMPWLKERIGKEGALQYFMIVGEFIFHDFRVLSVMGNESHVAAEISFDAEIPATGGQLKKEEIHLWAFDEQGKVIRFRHFSDTARQITAVIADSQIHNPE